MMSNKGLLVDNLVDNNAGIVSTVNRAYASLLQLAAYELGEVTLVNGLTCDTHISYRSSRGYTEIIADKGKKMTTMTIVPWSRTRDDRWPLWISDSVSNRTTVRSTLLTEDEAKQLLANEPASIPVQRAVCVLARAIGPDASMAFENFYSHKEVDLVSEEDLLGIIQLDRAGVGRLLRALPSAIDDYNNDLHRVPRPKVLRYSNLFEHRVFDRNNGKDWGEIKPMSPIRAEKLVLSLWLVMAVAIKERDALLRLLLPDSTIVPEDSLTDGDQQRLYEAADKVIGKMCVVGMLPPSILAKAKAIYESQY